MRSWNGWLLSLDSWIVQDGNYPAFAGGQQAEFAIGFYFPERRELDDVLGEREGCLGGAAVGVEHDSAVWLRALEGHDERVAEELSVHPDAHRPVHISHERSGLARRRDPRGTSSLACR
jgi:hypothetical protein